MTDFNSLLPSNSTPFERGFEHASHHDVDPSSLRLLDSPADIPAPQLPWLAWADDALWWNDAFSEQEKRGVTADSWNLHRYQGTLYALKKMAVLAGSHVVSAVTPPAKSFCSSALTVAQRNAFLSVYPQLRVFKYRNKGQRTGLHCSGFIGGTHYLTRSDAFVRMQSRAFLFKDGVETALNTTTREFITEDVLRVKRVSISSKGAFCNAPRASFITKMNAETRLYTVKIESRYETRKEVVHSNTVTPGLDAIFPLYDWVAEKGLKSTFFIGDGLRGALKPSTAHDRLYKRFYLFDPAIALARRGASLFCGSARLGMPAHNAQLNISVAGRRNPLLVSRFSLGYFGVNDKRKLTKTLQAMRTVARCSDRIAVNTHDYSIITASPQHVAGQRVAGQWLNA